MGSAHQTPSASPPNAAPTRADVACAPLPLTLFGVADPEVAAEPVVTRTELDPCCWVDVTEQFIVGADRLFDTVVEHFDWERGRRLMYGDWLDEPRLTAKPRLTAGCVPPVVRAAVDQLNGHYQRSFKGLFCNFYQRGEDSVAWHADQIGRTSVDPLVAIISLGGPRTFAMRSQSPDHRATHRWTLHSGDLLVMGGATQHHWEHSIPKAKGAPPRISLTTRAGVNVTRTR